MAFMLDVRASGCDEQRKNLSRLLEVINVVFGLLAIPLGELRKYQDDEQGKAGKIIPTVNNNS